MDELDKLVCYRKNMQGTYRLHFIIIANKCDLNEQRVVSKEEGEALASEF